MSDPKTREQSGLPRIIVQCIQRLYQHARPYLPDSALTLGGGTVLAARWSHRISTDAYLFCPPETFDVAVRAHGTELEAALRSIADDSEQTFLDPSMVQALTGVDRIAVYARISNIEVTILPAVRHIAGRTLQYVPGTGIETWSSANILAGKLLHRVYEGGVVEPRDLYDIAAATHRDPDALREAVAVLTARQQHAVYSRLALLPERWADASDKPLLGGLAPFSGPPDPRKSRLFELRTGMPVLSFWPVRPGFSGRSNYVAEPHCILHAKTHI